jgi:general secretion pathway protein B
MSYILEALKKAQAERQLGEVPSVHAPAMQVGADAPASGKLKKPMVAAMAVMASVIVALLALVWRKGEAPQPAPSNAPVMAALPVAPAPAPVTVASPAIAPQAAVPSAPLAPVEAKPLPAAAPQMPAVAVAPAPASVPAPAQEEVTQTARDLPEPIQRSLPPIVVGGYIYSKDPADRLLLIDKVLRHEGEEVAPGLVLEKLLPKSAVFSFKGYRYRVPY